jgi:hypothetical protein
MDDLVLAGLYGYPEGEDPKGKMRELVNAIEMASREKHSVEGNGRPPAYTSRGHER